MKQSHLNASDRVGHPKKCYYIYSKKNIYRINISTKSVSVPVSEILFSKFNQTFMGYFDPVNIILTIKLNNSRGDLTNVTAKTITLVHVSFWDRRFLCCGFVSILITSGFFVTEYRLGHHEMMYFIIYINII